MATPPSRPLGGGRRARQWVGTTLPALLLPLQTNCPFVGCAAQSGRLLVLLELVLPLLVLVVVVLVLVLVSLMALSGRGVAETPN
mmetsp:Transcript_53455/g.107315  ORF Transcript_53455/g.107315 Transcript_53455/m.107315 type:complete len:85 (+) Transcript_53455:344-598(+)